MPPIIEAILDTLLAAAGCAVVLYLLNEFLDGVFGCSLLDCFSRDAWRERPISCVVGVVVFALVAVFLISAFFGVLLYGDEPYRTWP